MFFRRFCTFAITLGLAAYTPTLQAGGIDGSTGRGSAPSIRKDSQDGQGQANQGAGINNALGGMFTGVGAACAAAQQYGCAAAMFAAAALSFAQAAMQSGGAGKYGNVVAATDLGGAYGGSTGAGTGFDVDPNHIDTDSFPDGINPGFDQLKAQGFRYDHNLGVVTLPNGEEIPVDKNSFKSLSALGAAAGLKGSALSNFLKDSEKIAKGEGDGQAEGSGATVSSMEVNSAGGASQQSGAGKEAFTGDPLAAIMDKYKKRGGIDGNNKLAGLQKTFMGDPIGLASDDIFMMVHRRYQKHRAAKEFIETMGVPGAAGGPTVRAPASPVRAVPEFLK